MILGNFFCFMMLVSFPIPIQQASNPPVMPPSASNAEAEYRIGTDDLIEVSVFELPDLKTISRVTASGTLTINPLGAINALGKTPQELEQLVETEFQTKNYIKNPKVQVFVKEYGSQPVSVVGAVKIPGTYQMRGPKSLVDMIAAAQGLDASVGKTIQIIRRDPKSQNLETTPISIDVEELFENGRAELNVPIRAGDVVNVLRAGSVFVVGEVNHPDEFILRSGRDITVTQAIARGGGFAKDAKKKQCLIIRPHPDGSKEEIPIDAQKILSGKSKDMTMLPNDVLFIPSNKVRTGINRVLDSVISVAVGRAIYVR